jgi:ribosome-associated protein
MTTSESAAKKDIQKLQKAIVEGLEDVKGQDIVVFNTEELSPLFERVIIASGTSNRQTKALAASVRDAVREAGFDKPRIEGEDNGEWIIVECGQAVAHVMQPVIRQYYRLEEIWGAKPVRLKAAAKAAAGAAKPRTQAAADDAAPAKAPARKAPAKKAAAAAPKPAPRRAGRAAPAGKRASTGSSAKPAAGSSRSAKPAGKTVAKPAGKSAKPRAALPKVVVNAPATKKKASPKAAAPAARKAAKPAVKKKT